MNSRRTIIVVGILVIVIVLFGGFYFFRGDKKEVGQTEVERSNPIFEGDFSDSFGGQGGENSINSLETSPENRAAIPKLRQISFKEVSGFGLFDEEGTTTIRFIDKESGNIFETNSKSLDINRVSNTTILKTINSWWLDKENFLLQYLDEAGAVKTFRAQVVKNEEEELGEVVGSFLDDNIIDISILNEEAFYLTRSNGQSTGFILKKSSEEPRTIFQTPLTEIFSSFYKGGELFINTKPSAFSLGNAFLVDTRVGQLQEVLGDIRGFFGLPTRVGQDLLYSQTENVGVSLWLETPGGKRILPKQTLADKCVWGNSSEETIFCAVPQNLSQRGLPDEWYKGNVSFVDDVWAINTETNKTTLLLEPTKEFGLLLDVENIKLDEEERNLFFINKTNGTLWSLKLENKDLNQSPLDNE